MLPTWIFTFMFFHYRIADPTPADLDQEELTKICEEICNDLERCESYRAKHERMF